MRVSDRGCGFIVDDARRRGFGLVGMTERVRLAGGIFAIDSRPGAGAQFDVWLPVPAAAGDTPNVTGTGPAGLAGPAGAVAIPMTLP